MTSSSAASRLFSSATSISQRSDTTRVIPTCAGSRSCASHHTVAWPAKRLHHILVAIAKRLQPVKRASSPRVADSLRCCGCEHRPQALSRSQLHCLTTACWHLTLAAMHRAPRGHCMQGWSACWPPAFRTSLSQLRRHTAIGGASKRSPIQPVLQPVVCRMCVACRLTRSQPCFSCVC